MFEKFLINFAIPRKKLFEFFGIVLFLTIFFAFISLAYGIFRQEVLSLDVEITHALQDLSYLTIPMMFVSVFGDLAVSSVLFLAVVGFLYFKGYRREAAFMPAILATPLLNTILKETIERPRPSEALVNVFDPLPQYSFPSGHVMYYVVFFGFVAFLAASLPKLEPRWRAFLLTISLPLIFLVGISRVYLGAHWPSDVLGAYLFGGLYLSVLILIYLKYLYRLP